MTLEIMTLINTVLVGYLIAAVLWQMNRFNKHLDWHRKKEAAADADKRNGGMI